LIVNPRGEVKPCCGFASDLDQLTIGNIHEHSAAEIIRRGRRHPYVGKIFREGLTAIRDEILSRDPNALPGATSNHCYFCWYVLTRGLANGVNGGGGQVGNWTGERANHRGELIQVGMMKRSGNEKTERTREVRHGTGNAQGTRTAACKFGESSRTIGPG